MLHQLHCLARTRPDPLSPVKLFSQTTARTYSSQSHRLINHLQRCAASNSELALAFNAFYHAMLHLIFYSDASFASNADGTFQIGFKIFLGEWSVHAGIIQFTRGKAKRVVRLVLGSEIFALVTLRIL